MELEATIVGKYSAVAPVLDERSRRRWAAAESAAIGYGGDALVSSATGLARETIRNGRREIARGEPPTSRIRAPGAGRPGIEQDQPGVLAALEALVDPLTRGDPTSPLRWTCKSRAKLAAALSEQGWRVSSTTVGRLLHRLGYRLQSVRKRQEGTVHPDRNEQFEHINATAAILGVDPRESWPLLVNGVADYRTQYGPMHTFGVAVPVQMAVVQPIAVDCESQLQGCLLTGTSAGMVTFMGTVQSSFPGGATVGAPPPPTWCCANPSMRTSTRVTRSPSS